MKIREYLGGALMLLAVLLLVAITGGDEASWQLIFFLTSIAIFIGLLGHQIGQFGIFSWSKKMVSKILTANYFLIMLLAPFQLPWPVQALNTIIALALLIYWVWPLLKKKPRREVQVTY